VQEHGRNPEAGGALTPVARTAYYCCILRADDAASADPVCGDALAARFLDAGVRRDLLPATRIGPPAASNVARHRLIDDLVRHSLSRDADRRILLVGAGFDTRAFRMAGGRWWEFDEAALLAAKESRLAAADAPNPLSRVAVDFERESMAAHLARAAGNDAALVILEGVSMYVPDEGLGELALAVRQCLPNATLVCDLMSPAFARRFGGPLRRELAKLGATFAPRAEHPSPIFESAGFRTSQRLSIIERAREARTLRIPRWLLATLLRELRDGYAVWVFVPPERAP
jgi:methyltransferase (TIGR00027 family)